MTRHAILGAGGIGGLIGAGLAKQIVDTFLDTECTADRHLRRAAMIDEIGS